VTSTTSQNFNTPKEAHQKKAVRLQFTWVKGACKTMGIEHCKDEETLYNGTKLGKSRSTELGGKPPTPWIIQFASRVVWTSSGRLARFGR
jgi:hypothetical protein